MIEADGGWFTRHWRWIVLALWIVSAAVLVYLRWNAIQWFALGDTDDNLRMAQVRALMNGQDWYDLRQYRLNPPFGADIHWSRLVDLPIAGIKLALTPLTGGKTAETAAVTLAPMLPMLVGMFAMAVAARRLIAPRAFILGAGLLLCAHSVRGMWSPLRIDHHGWQLALLAIVVAGLVDRNRRRGGLTIGVATALSLSIGLEMLLYLALAGILVGLVWVRDKAEAPRLGAYGVSLGGGSALGYLLFASYANAAPVCDALSPVWLSVMLAAGALALLLSLASPGSLWVRLGLGALAGGLIVGFYALAWPHCLGRLEGASAEAQQLWLSKVREAMPIYKHAWRTGVTVASLPAIGLVGYGVMLWRNRRDPAALMPWASVALLALLAAALLLWQTRAGPAAQLLAVPGAAGLAWLLVGWFRAQPYMLVRVFGTVAALVLASGLVSQWIAALIPQEEKSARSNLVGKANGTCPTLPALRPIARQPKGLVLTHVDLGPRLVSVTHHDAIAGPYHRNDGDIVAIMRAFRGSGEEARRTVFQRDVDYVLICPNLSETTIYRAEAPNGFYVQLTRGKVPDWLERVTLPAGSPYMMWRVRR